jgi:hypothetical protein
VKLWTPAAERVLLGLWIAAVVVVSVQATATHSNNFEIFRSSWLHLSHGDDLYATSTRYRDVFIYTPSFALLFAPIAMLPFAVGVFVWNSLNAGALYWALGRVLTAEQAFLARLIVFADTVGSMQQTQSNALVAALIITTLAELERRVEWRAAGAVVAGAVIKVFPLVAATFAVFRLYRLPKFALYLVTFAVAAFAAPLIVITPSRLAAYYHEWFVWLTHRSPVERGYSIMAAASVWTRMPLLNWPIQALGTVLLLAPLTQLPHWGSRRFRRLFLASTLMYCVLFNHAAESPSFVIAVAGAAIWFVMSNRDRVAWVLIWIVVVVTALSSGEAMPQWLQRNVFEPYRLKTIPILLVWLLTQRELWRRSVSVPFQGRVPEHVLTAT